MKFIFRKDFMVLGLVNSNTEIELNAVEEIMLLIWLIMDGRCTCVFAGARFDI